MNYRELKEYHILHDAFAQKLALEAQNKPKAYL